MADKSWMLNPTAIRHANECIHIIKESEGLRLKLSQSDFLEQLKQFASKSESESFDRAYGELIAMAGKGSGDGPAKAVVAQASTARARHHEMVEVNGQMYPKFRNGQQFRGVQDGVASYR